MNFTAVGNFLPFAVTTWANATGTWQDPQWLRPWFSSTFTQNVPSILLAPDLPDRRLFLYDYKAMTDDGAPIEWTLTTRQIGDESVYVRWERAVMFGEGSDVSVEFSQDGGESWQALGTTDFVGLPSVAVVFIDHASTHLQLRLSGDDPAFQLRRVTVLGVVESEW